MQKAHDPAKPGADAESHDHPERDAQSEPTLSQNPTLTQGPMRMQNAIPMLTPAPHHQARLSLPKLIPAPDLVEQVYTALSKAIGAGVLPPGSRITQEQLAEHFHVSRQPVLQALRLLKRDGLVRDAPGRGVLVAPLEAQTIRWVYQLRGALDDLAAALAASRRASIDPARIREGRRAAARRDLAALIDADLAFHAALYDASGNPMIGEAAGRHWCHIRRAMGVFLRAGFLQTVDTQTSVWDEHEAIAEAVASGNTDRARQLSQAHTGSAGDALVRLLSEAHTEGAHHTTGRQLSQVHINAHPTSAQGIHSFPL